MNSNSPVRILITGAAGNIGYSLAFMIGQGRMFGKDKEVILHLFDLPHMEDALKGIHMELNDCAFDILKEVITTSDPSIAFKDIDFAIFCGTFPPKEGMERKDLIKANTKIFEDQGKYLEKYAKKTVKTLVVGDPANTNALVLTKNAGSIPVENFSAMTRLNQNKATAKIADITKSDVKSISDVIIWGNHSSTQYPDISFAYIGTDSVKDLISDKEGFIKSIQSLGTELIKLRKLASIGSAANAICDHMRDWILGTNGRKTSMAVMSKGEYGVPEGIIYSFPVTCENGNWTIVKGLEISDFSREKLDISAKELLEEKEMSLQFLN